MRSKLLAGTVALAAAATVMVSTGPASAWDNGWGPGWGVGAALGTAAAVATAPLWAPGCYGAYGGYYPNYANGPGYAYGWGSGPAYAYSPGFSGYYAAPAYGGYYGGPSAGYTSETYASGPGGGRDEAYCARRYRSYDPASGTFLGYDGVRHPCP